MESTLPDELVHRVCTYLAPEDAQALSETCSSLHTAIEDECVWRPYVHKLPVSLISTQTLQPGKSGNPFFEEPVMTSLLSGLTVAAIVTAVWYYGVLLNLWIDPHANLALVSSHWMPHHARQAWLWLLPATRLILPTALLLGSLALIAFMGLSLSVPLPAGRQLRVSLPALSRGWRTRFMRLSLFFGRWLDRCIEGWRRCSAGWATRARHLLGVRPSKLCDLRYSARQVFSLRTGALRNWRSARFREHTLDNVRGTLITVNETFLVVLHATEINVYSAVTGVLLYLVPCERMLSAERVAATRTWLAVSYLDNGGPRVWNMRDRKSMFFGRRVLPTNSVVSRLHAVRDDVMACSAMDGSVSLWHLPSLTMVCRLTHEPDYAITCLAHWHYPDPNTAMGTTHGQGDDRKYHTRQCDNPVSVLATSSRSTQHGSGQICVWDVPQRQVLVTLRNVHTGPANSMQFNMIDGGLVLLSSSIADKRVNLWECATGRCVRSFVLHAAPVAFCTWRNDVVVSVDVHGMLLCWSILTGLTPSHRGSEPSSPLHPSGVSYKVHWAARLSTFPITGVPCVDEYGLLASWGYSLRYLDFRPRSAVASWPVLASPTCVEDNKGQVNAASAEWRCPTRERFAAKGFSAQTLKVRWSSRSHLTVERVQLSAAVRKPATQDDAHAPQQRTVSSSSPAALCSRWWVDANWGAESTNQPRASTQQGSLFDFLENNSSGTPRLWTTVACVAESVTENAQ